MTRAISLLTLSLAAVALTTANASAKGADAALEVRAREVKVGLAGKDMTRIMAEVRNAAVLVCADARFWPEDSSYQARGVCGRGSYDAAMQQVRRMGLGPSAYAASRVVRVAAIRPLRAR